MNHPEFFEKSRIRDFFATILIFRNISMDLLLRELSGVLS